MQFLGQIRIQSGTFMENWIYVVLSRVRTLKGLYLLKPLPKNSLEKFVVPPELKAFESRMRELETHVIQSREGKMNQIDNDLYF